MQRVITITILLVSIFATTVSANPRAGTQARYRVIPGARGDDPSFQTVTVTYGPGNAWQLTLHQKLHGEGEPMMHLRCVTNADPLNGDPESLTFTSYKLHIPATKETYDYRDAIQTGYALLPGWDDFKKHFIPQPARATGRTEGIPNTCQFLGHVLTLERIEHKADWTPWDNVTVLDLDNELWIATGRTKKDTEEKRLPPDKIENDYNYASWTPDNYETLIDAGMNVFSLNAGIETYVRSQPVFYRRGVRDNLPLTFPVDLYRSNYIGPSLYLDEPSCIMTGDERFYVASKFFSDAVAALVSRVEAQEPEVRYNLESELRNHKVNLGNMRLGQTNFVSWETRYSTTYYQMLAGAPGLVQEGRWQLDNFNSNTKATTGLERVHTAEEMFRYEFAIMRGAAHRFGGDWGTAIYGQADPAITPLAATIAYDMGARYLWFWTSDHGHHMPWPEQLELTRHLKAHAKKHPRPSIRATTPERDKLLLIPYGYFPILESPTNRKQPWDLWWVREMDPDKKNDKSQQYRKLMRGLLTEVHKCFDANEDFDISIDDGSKPKGYKQIIRISD